MASKAKSLYRSILKAHRSKLPHDLRDFGDMYVRNEFNLHKKVTAVENLNQFYKSWEDYLKSLEPQTKEAKFGRDLTEKEKVILTKDQQDKLDELLRESRTPSPPSAEA